MSKETRQNVLRHFLGKSRLPLGTLTFLRRFTYKEIKRATDGFSRILNGGAYKAQFSDGFIGIVRRVKSLEPEGDRSAAAFYRELLVIARFHHRHLVDLHGFCDEQERFLVFDFMENGSLREIIHDPLRTPLTWRTRLKIIVEVAASLEYLCIFCDDRPSDLIISADNIFLDEDFVAKLSTFESMGVDRKVKERKDDKKVLFQFGALILELVTGQSFGSQGEDLVRWIEGADFLRSMDAMVDSDLGSDYDSDQLWSLLHVARACIGKVNGFSLTISGVHRFLQRKVNGCCSL